MLGPVKQAELGQAAGVGELSLGAAAAAGCRVLPHTAPVLAVAGLLKACLVDTTSRAGPRRAPVPACQASMGRRHSLPPSHEPPVPLLRCPNPPLPPQVGDARAQEPAALIYLCACKSDLLAPAQRVPAQQAAAAEPALEVEVERVNGGGGAAPISPWLWLQQQQQQQAQQQQQQQAQQQQAQQQAQPQQQQQQQQAQPQPRAEPQVAAAGWKSPARGAGGRRSLDAPTTPLKADRQSPSGSQGTPGSPVPATAAGRKVAAEHARAAAAEVVASLTGQAVPSPFAAAAQPPAGSGAWSPGQRPGSGASHASASPSGGGGGASPEGWQAASSGASHQRASKPGSRQQEQRRQQQERQRGASPEAGGSPAAGGRRVGTPRRRPRVRLQQESDGEGEEEEEAAPPLQQAAVPQAAIQHYCRTEGLPLVWVSSRTGGLRAVTLGLG